MQPPTPGALDHPDLGSALNEVLTPEMREKMARQEKEMEILKRRLAESETALEAGGGAGVGRGSAVAPGQRGSREETAIIGGAGGGAAEQTVAAIQQQLREKIQRISQLEAIAQESSQYRVLLCRQIPATYGVPLLLLHLSTSPLPPSQGPRPAVWRRCGESRMRRLKSIKSTSTKPRRSSKALERVNLALQRTVWR